VATCRGAVPEGSDGDEPGKLIAGSNRTDIADRGSGTGDLEIVAQDQSYVEASRLVKTETRGQVRILLNCESSGSWEGEGT